MGRKKLVVLTGAGISAESGIKTFRDSNGLWEGHDVYEVASPQGFAANPALVLDFYNVRRRQMLTVSPNEGHKALVRLESRFDTTIITQNVDDLHERAGSTNVLHLHGEIAKARSTADEDLVLDWTGKDLKVGDLCPLGSQLRPHVVWFGEDVPEFPRAVGITAEADIVLIVGTSMVVYPANTIVEYAPPHADIYLVDPQTPSYSTRRTIEYIAAPASTGVPALVDRLLEL